MYRLAIKVETMRKAIIICCAYRPPEADQAYADLLSNDISSIVKKHKASPHWIGGDFNLPDINWETNSILSHP